MVFPCPLLYSGLDKALSLLPQDEAEVIKTVVNRQQVARILQWEREKHPSTPSELLAYQNRKTSTGATRRIARTISPKKKPLSSREARKLVSPSPPRTPRSHKQYLKARWGNRSEKRGEDFFALGGALSAASGQSMDFMKPLEEKRERETGKPNQRSCPPPLTPPSTRPIRRLSSASGTPSLSARRAHSAAPTVASLAASNAPGSTFFDLTTHKGSDTLTEANSKDGSTGKLGQNVDQQGNDALVGLLPRFLPEFHVGFSPF